MSRGRHSKLARGADGKLVQPTAKPPRCPAKWPVGENNGLAELRRPCNRFATVAVNIGWTVYYCPEHAADREASEVARRAQEAARDKVVAHRRAMAQAFVDSRPGKRLGDEAGWSMVTPPGIRIVFAARCACGQLLAREHLVDHYATCEVAP